MQKMVLFIEMLESGEEMIEKETVQQFFSSCLMRNISNENLKVGDVINEMFEDEISFNKKDFAEKLVKDNNEFKNLVDTFMQQPKD